MKVRLAAAATVLLLAAITSLPAVAAAPLADDDAITWSIKPVPLAGDVERPNFTITAVPGQVIQDAIRVRVLGSTPIAFQVYASDAFVTDSGGFDLLAGDKPPTDVGSWVELESQTILVEPGTSQDIPFTLTIPPDATPGDHAGGIVTSITSVATGQGGVPVRVERRLGTRIYLRVDGPIDPRLEIRNLEASFDGAWNPTGRGTVRVGYVVANPGNVRLKAGQSVTVDGLIGDKHLEPEDLPELLPGSELKVSHRIEGVPASGRLKVEVALTPYPAAEGETLDPGPPPVRQSAAVFALAWALLILLAVLAAGSAFWWRLRKAQPTLNSKV